MNDSRFFLLFFIQQSFLLLFVFVAQKSFFYSLRYPFRIEFFIPLYTIPGRTLNVSDSLKRKSAKNIFFWMTLKFTQLFFN